MATATVRINPGTHEILRELAAREGKPMQAILDRAIEEYRRQRFLRESNSAYAALSNNPKKWKEELAERKEWDATLTDGQEDE